MAAADIEQSAEIPCERDSALAEAAATVGPLRDPDGCVLACPDCTCRRLLEQRRGERDAELRYGETPPAATG